MKKHSILTALAVLITSTVATVASADQFVIMEPIVIEVPKSPAAKKAKVWVCTEESLRSDSNTVRFCRWIVK